MRKILNFLLVFILSIVVVGIGFANVEAAATTDVTINLHIHQIDGDYTDTGSGAWDGIKWNDWDFTYGGDAYATVTQSTDDFGKFISIVYTADQINLVANEIQFKPTRNTGVDESVNYLAPGNGEVFANVEALKDGSETTLDLYYVEGAEEFVLGEDGLGLLFVVYVDPNIAADTAAYDDWEMWTWDNGTDGTADLLEFDQDLSIKSGIYKIEGRLGVIKVDDDATLDTGFKFRLGEWVEQTANYSFDNTDIRGTGAAVVHIERGITPYYADGATFSTEVHDSYELLAGNKFVEGTVISSPTTVEVTMLMPKNPGGFDISRFTLLDNLGVAIPIVSAVTDTMSELGTYASDVTCGVGEYKFILYVTSDLDHSKLGVVGSLQGWNITGAITSTKDDSEGNAVFEYCTTSTSGEYKLVFDDEDNGFEWNTDPEITADNQQFDFLGENTSIYYIDASTPVVGSFTSDFTPGAGEKTVIIYFETDLAGDVIGAVGEFANTWDIGNAYTSTKDDSMGYAVFEIPTTQDTGEFKIVHDDEGNGFEWTVDPELTIQLSYDLTDIDSVEIFIDSSGTTTYVLGEKTNATPLETATLTLTVDVANELQFGEDFYVNYDELKYENHVTVYVNTDLDHSLLGMVGSPQGWDIANPITSTQDGTNGYAVFEFVIEESSGEFKILFEDNGDAGFNWNGDGYVGDSEVTPSNIAFEVEGSLVLYIDAIPMDEEPAANIGTFVSDFTPGDDEKTIIIHFETTEDHSSIGAVGNFVREWDVSDIYTSTKDDTTGYAVFELPTTTDIGEFKILYNDGVDDVLTLEDDESLFDWGDTNLTSQLAYNLTGIDTLEIFIDATGTVTKIVEGTSVPSPYATIETNNDTVGTYVQAVFTSQFSTGIVEGLLEFGLSNNFIAGDAVANTGTYAVTETEFVVEFTNSAPFMTDIVLVDSSETVIAVEAVDYIHGVGEYTELVSCTSRQSKLIVYLNTIDAEVTELSQLRLVGSLQGWNPANGINPVGMDSLGNYVFEICLYSASEDVNETTVNFKILFDAEEDFDWDDSLNPDTVDVDIDPISTVYVEEGNTNEDTKYQVFTLLEVNALSTDETYQLRFTDENGFKVFIDLEIDNIGPVLYDTIKADIEFNVEKGSDFDIMDYYNIFEYIDTRAGNIDYVVTSDIDTSVLGAQTFTVTATDLWMNVSTFSVDFTVVDTIAPVITLSTAPELEAGDTEPDWATYATANEGTIVVDSSQVDMSVAGTYFINYTATDGEDNESSLSLEVTIDAVEVPVEDTTGCFGSIGNGSAFIIFGIVAVLGGAALFFLRRV